MPFPNDDTKFKPGQSGNVNGRPKGTRNLSTILREMIEEEVEVNIQGVRSRKQFQEVIISTLLKKAHKGNIKAIIEIFDRLEGKAKQVVDMNFDSKRESIGDLFKPLEYDMEEGNATNTPPPEPPTSTPPE